MKYTISEYFTPEARKIAADILYRPDEQLKPRYNGFCPLGIMLTFDGIIGYDGVGRYRSPSAWDVAIVLTGSISSENYMKILCDTSDFVRDFDECKIINLREALDVK